MSNAWVTCTNKLAVIITQTGGGCRATNYISFIRRALAKAGQEQIPVVSLNLNHLETNPGFKITPSTKVSISSETAVG